MGVVEVILIIVVLIGLVIIFQGVNLDGVARHFGVLPRHIGGRVAGKYRAGVVFRGRRDALLS